MFSSSTAVEARDRHQVQNHTLPEVNSKRYDLRSDIREKRSGMAKWDKFARATLPKRRQLKLVA
jgi:hypothetical protein